MEVEGMVPWWATDLIEMTALERSPHLVQCGLVDRVVIHVVSSLLCFQAAKDVRKLSNMVGDFKLHHVVVVVLGLKSTYICVISQGKGNIQPHFEQLLVRTHSCIPSRLHP